MENKEVENRLFTINRELGEVKEQLTLIKWVIGLNITITSSIFLMLITKII